MPVTITKHAEQRLKERMGLNKKALQRAAETAYDKGVKHQETTGNLKNGSRPCILITRQPITSGCITGRRGSLPSRS